MNNNFDKLEQEIALLVRLTTAISPKLGELDRSGYILLSKLDNSKPLAINVLAEQLKLNVSTASRQIAALEKKGLVKRFPDAKNGRTSLIEITPKGQEIFRKVKKARTEAYAEILRNWPHEKLEQLEADLAGLNQALKEWKK